MKPVEKPYSFEAFEVFKSLPLRLIDLYDTFTTFGEDRLNRRAFGLRMWGVNDADRADSHRYFMFCIHFISLAPLKPGLGFQAYPHEHKHYRYLY